VWLCTEPDMKCLVDALRSDPVGRADIADKVKEKIKNRDLAK